MMFPFDLLRRAARSDNLGARHDYVVDKICYDVTFFNTYDLYRCRICDRAVKVRDAKLPDSLPPSELYGCPGPDSLLSRLEAAERDRDRWRWDAVDRGAEADRCCEEIAEVTGRLMAAEAERDRLREYVRVLEETLERYRLA